MTINNIIDNSTDKAYNVANLPHIVNNTVNTDHKISGSIYDIDLSGLHTPEQVTIVNGKRLRYITPSAYHKSLIFTFFLVGLKDVIATKLEQEKYTIEHLRQLVANKLQFLGNPSNSKEESQQKQEILGYLFVNSEGMRYLLEVISDCFPDLNAKRLTNDTLMDLFGILLDAINDKN